MSAKIVNYITNLISSCQDEDFINLWESEEKDKVMEMIKEDLEKKSSKKKKKDKNAPKKNVSKWILFSKAERPKVKKDFPDMPPKEVMGELAKRWKIAQKDDEAMEEFRILAEEDKKRYEEEKKNYVPNVDEESEEGKNVKNGKKKCKKAKVPGQPKKSKSSWLFFCDEERKKLKDEEDAPKGKEVLSELASRWKVLKENGGKKYEKFEDMAKKDKERYLQEMKNWNPDKKEESENEETTEDEKPVMTEEKEVDEEKVDEEKVEKELDEEEEEDEKPLPKKKGKKKATKSRVNK